MTIREHLGGFDGVRVAWIGDGNNVCASLAEICAKLGMEFAAASPAGYELAGIESVRDPREAARGANVVVTDAWTSMGQEEETERRRRDFDGYRVDGELLAAADREAIVLHCLPAHVGDEITADVLYGPQCAAWDEAENRLHSEKALLALVVL
jgi:ornithine carbamoyltransferase